MHVLAGAAAPAREAHEKTLTKLLIDEIKKKPNAAEIINARDSLGNTALHEAVFFGRADVAGELVKAGADLNIQNKAGKTAISQPLDGLSASSTAEKAAARKAVIDTKAEMEKLLREQDLLQSSGPAQERSGGGGGRTEKAVDDLPTVMAAMRSEAPPPDKSSEPDQKHPTNTPATRRNSREHNDGSRQR